MRGLALLSLLLAAAPAVAEETEFEPGRDFADASACRAHLTELAGDARRLSHAAIEGPYEIAAGDVRIHIVLAEGNGHRIAEHRCLAEKSSARSWTHSMAGGDEEFTVESVVRSAGWLQQEGGEQQ